MRDPTQLLRVAASSAPFARLPAAAPRCMGWRARCSDRRRHDRSKRLGSPGRDLRGRDVRGVRRARPSQSDALARERRRVGEEAIAWRRARHRAALGDDLRHVDPRPARARVVVDRANRLGARWILHLVSIRQRRRRRTSIRTRCRTRSSVRARCRRRSIARRASPIYLNLGRDERAFLFVPHLAEDLGAKGASASGDRVEAFFRANPGCPVVRVRLAPGEA